jgi:hypothetical protein
MNDDSSGPPLNNRSRNSRENDNNGDENVLYKRGSGSYGECPIQIHINASPNLICNNNSTLGKDALGSVLSSSGPNSGGPENKEQKTIPITIFRLCKDKESR